MERIGLICILLAAFAWALTPFERKFVNSSAVFTGKIQTVGFEEKAPGVSIRKYFAEVKPEGVFKGDIPAGQHLRVLVGGKTLYNDKLCQVGDTDLPVGLRAVFYLGYLFPDERAFSSGAEYYLDLAVPVVSDSVYARFAPKPVLAVSEFERLLGELSGRFGAGEIFRGSEIVAAARIRQAGMERTGGLRVSLELDSAVALKGRLDSAHLVCSFPDDFRRIHFRNRKRSDVPFYISRDAVAQRNEEQSNFFLSAGQRVMVCLNQSGNRLNVHLGHMGVFLLNDQELLYNRYCLPVPRPLAQIMLP